jgi:hypothetical protein
MIPTITRLPTDYEREVHRQLCHRRLRNILLRTILIITTSILLLGTIYVLGT